jgi:phosphate transport system ATP-binding protein
MGVGIQVEKLNAWFSKTQALHDINMNVVANHATAVIGPSGCGKSTFVRCLNRMHETIPEARATGRVRIGDLMSTTALRPCRSAAALEWCFKNPILFPPIRSMTMWRPDLN